MLLLSTPVSALKIPTEEGRMNKLDGKITLISGDTSGIGLATANRFVAEGAVV